MKKRLLTLTTALAMAFIMAIPVGAADLHFDHVGTECEFGFESLHFVNNQTEGATAAGTITVEFNLGPDVIQSSDQVNRNMQHFRIGPVAATVLVGASTDLPGKLVLSDFTCLPEGPGGSV